MISTHSFSLPLDASYNVWVAVLHAVGPSVSVPNYASPSGIFLLESVATIHEARLLMSLPSLSFMSTINCKQNF